MPATTCLHAPVWAMALSSRMPATLPPSTSTSFGHFTRTRAARRHDVGDGKRRDEAQFCGPRRRTIGPQDRRAVEVADRRGPVPAAPPAPAGLLARPHDGALGGAGLGEARRLRHWCCRPVERDQRPPVRQDGREDHGNRPFAAAAATSAERLRRSENTATRMAAAKATARLTLNTGRSSASPGSSKYITLTMRR